MSHTHYTIYIVDSKAHNRIKKLRTLQPRFNMHALERLITDIIGEHTVLHTQSLSFNTGYTVSDNVDH